MKIMHVITGLDAGGAERALATLLGHGIPGVERNHVLSLKDEGVFGPVLRGHGIAVDSLGMRAGLPSFRALVRLRESVRAIEPDVVQGWMYHGNLAATLARAFNTGSVPLVWNMRQTLYDLRREKLLTRQVIRAGRVLSSQCSAIIYNSHLSSQQHRDFGYSDRCVRVIPNGFDTQRWIPDVAARTRIRQELGIPADAPVLGHFARFHRMKDHPGFIEALRPLLQRLPELRVVMAGTGVTRADPAFGRLASQLPVDRVFTLGERSDMEALMASVDVFCLSSRWGEAFPNVLGEAMSCAVVPVTTDVGDAAHIVGETGYVVPPADVSGLARTLEQALGQPVVAREQLGHAARERVIRWFDLGAVTTTYGDLYQQLARTG